MKNKTPKLKPSAKDKRRYLLLNETNNTKIETAILDYIGILGFAKAAYKKVTDSKTPKGKSISSCLTKELVNVKAALTLAGIKVEKVSGTIKGLLK